jgi:hypothetical protein
MLFPTIFLIPEDTAMSKGRLAGSGLSGSTEVLLPDLEGKEFNLLFPDVDRIHELELLLSTLNSIISDNTKPLTRISQMSRLAADPPL